MALVRYGANSPRIGKSVFVAPTATIVGDVRVGRDSSIWYGAVIRGDMHYVRIGKSSSVQDNAVFHGTADKYPTIIGDNVSVGHNAIVHGCTIGSNCLIGMGSIILEGAKIGDWCIVGAGAVVPEGMVIPPKSIVMGIPARIRGRITQRHKKRITHNWKAYVALKDTYIEADKDG